MDCPPGQKKVAVAMRNEVGVVESCCGELAPLVGVRLYS